jgi:hypothetical protein
VLAILALCLVLLFGLTFYLFSSGLLQYSPYSRPTPINTPHRPDATRAPGFTPIPYAAKTMTVLAQTPYATQTPRFRWVDLDPFGLRMELPDDWSWTRDLFDTPCVYGETRGKWIITSLSGDYLELTVSCPQMHDKGYGPCTQPVVLDESRQIYRVEQMLALTLYSKYYYVNGEMECAALGWPVGEWYALGAYYNRQTFDPNYPVVDRVLLSIQVK